jgi:hypothetical protein
MGTRGITQVIDTNGQTVVAQYGQWDHYPEGQGINVLNFLTSKYNIVDMLKNALFKCYWADEEERKSIYKNYVNEQGWMDMEQANLFGAAYPSLTRDTCSDILKVIVYSTGRVPLVNESEFMNDELFCEGIYTVNFQTNEFISQFGGRTVSFALDALPEQDEYLMAFSKEEELV